MKLFRGSAPQTVAIASSGTTSAAVRVGDYAMFGVVIPPAFTGTSLTFTVSADGTTYQQLCDNTGTAVSLSVTTSKSYDLPSALAAWPFFKIVSGSAEAAARSLVVVKKG